MTSDLVDLGQKHKLLVVASCVPACAIAYLFHSFAQTDMVASLAGATFIGYALAAANCDIRYSIERQLRNSAKSDWTPNDGGLSKTTLLVSVYLRTILWGQYHSGENNGNQVLSAANALPGFAKVLGQLVAYASPSAMTLTGVSILGIELSKKRLEISHSSVYLGLAIGGVVCGTQLLIFISGQKPKKLKKRWKRWRDKKLISISHQESLEYASSLIDNPARVPDIPAVRIPVRSMPNHLTLCKIRIENGVNIGMEFSHLVLRQPVSTMTVAVEVLGLKTSGGSIHLSDLDPVAFAIIRRRRGRQAQSSEKPKVDSADLVVASYENDDTISFNAKKGLGPKRTR